MKLKLVILFSMIVAMAQAQTETTRKFLEKNDGNGSVLTMYFYKNTLKMFNQNDSKEFDEMIKGIEKLRFMMIDKAKLNFKAAEYKALVKGYVGEDYEQMVTSRMDGRNFDVYMKDKSGSPLGTIILVNDSSSLYVMDMIGRIDVSKASKVFSEMQENSDLKSRIGDFLNKGKKKKEEGEEDHKND